MPPNENRARTHTYREGWMVSTNVDRYSVSLKLEEWNGTKAAHSFPYTA